jgi:chromosome segregation ATPase
MAFIEWLQPAMKAVERGQPMPDSSKLSGDVAAWAHAIRNLDERRREGEEIQLSLESEIRDREAYVGRLTNQLQASMGEVKTAQVAHQEAMQELATHKSTLARVADLATEVGGYDNQLKSIAGDMLSKGTQLEKLATSFREVAAALRTLTKSGPSQ